MESYQNINDKVRFEQMAEDWPEAGCLPGLRVLIGKHEEGIPKPGGVKI